MKWQICGFMKVSHRILKHFIPKVYSEKKREVIMQNSREHLKALAFEGLVKSTDETYVDPLDVYLLAEANKIAVTGISKRYPHTAKLKRTPPNIDREEQDEVRRILARCYQEITTNGDHIGSTVSLANILNEEERKTAELPADFVDIYYDAMKAAEKHCSKGGFSRYWHQHCQRCQWICW